MKFTVVVPTRDRPEQLRTCLGSLAGLDFPREAFEVVVVDDGGGVPEVVLRDAERRIDVRVVAQSPAGPAVARNRGLAHARGEFIAFTDDDCQVDPQWLSVLARELDAAPEKMIGGSTRNAHWKSSYSVASQNVIDFLYEYYNTPPEAARFFASNNLACRRDILLALGGFDGTFPIAAAEDRDLCERWLESGRPLLYVADAIVHHDHRLGFRTYVHQHFNYGGGANYLHRARARRGLDRPRLEPVTFYLQLVTFPLRSGASPRTVLFAILALLSQAAYGVGYYLERIRLRLMRRNEKESALGARRATDVAAP